MKARKNLLFLTLGLILILAACSGTPDSANPGGEKYDVTMTMLPDPPMMGEVLLTFTVVDAQGDPITGANVEVSADHTDMTGMSMNGPATDQGNGMYAITTNFSMTGNWKITVKVVNGTEEFSRDYNVEIQ